MINCIDMMLYWCLMIIYSIIVSDTHEHIYYSLHPQKNTIMGYVPVKSLPENCTLPSAWDFTECFLSGHSAKQYFAECHTRQNKALGKGGFAECQAPGKAWLSAKLGFAEVPLGKRWPARDGGHLPSDFAECLTAGTRQIFFYFKKLILPSASPRHSAIFFIF